MGHYLGLQMDFRRVITFCRQLFNRGTGYKLYLTDCWHKETGGDGTCRQVMVNKLNIVQRNTTSRNHTNGEKSNRRIGKGNVSASSWETTQKLIGF